MKILGSGTVKRIHVNRHVLAANKKLNKNDPAITIQTSKGPFTVRGVRIDGPSTFVQAGIDGVKPLSCGARVWVQTKSEVVIL